MIGSTEYTMPLSVANRCLESICKGSAAALRRLHRLPQGTMFAAKRKIKSKLLQGTPNSPAMR